jgi:hypothetical protein
MSAKLGVVGREELRGIGHERTLTGDTLGVSVVELEVVREQHGFRGCLTISASARTMPAFDQLADCVSAQGLSAA